VVYGGCDKSAGIDGDVLLALEAGGVVRNLPRRKADGGGLARTTRASSKRKLQRGRQ
jgi:hypothetical protein